MFFTTCSDLPSMKKLKSAERLFVLIKKQLPIAVSSLHKGTVCPVALVTHSTVCVSISHFRVHPCCVTYRLLSTGYRLIAIADPVASLWNLPSILWVLLFMCFLSRDKYTPLYLFDFSKHVITRMQLLIKTVILTE